MLPIDQILLFVLIGIVVSLDVLGLTAAKSITYLGSFKDVARWAQRNAFWHALLLFLYGIVAVGLLDKIVKDGLDWIIERLPDINLWPWAEALILETRTHFNVTVALVSICVVWAIYRKKIVENPLDAEREAHENQAGWDWQRRTISAALRLVKISPARIARQMEAVTVAVDMLALALLLKSLELFKESFATVASVSIIIYASVFGTVVLGSRLLRKSFSDLLGSGESDVRKAAGLNRVLLLIRICEPLLIFYFVIELLSFVVWGRMSSSALFFVASAILTFALIRSVGFENVINVTTEMARTLIRRAKVDDQHR